MYTTRSTWKERSTECTPGVPGMRGVQNVHPEYLEGEEYRMYTRSNWNERSNNVHDEEYLEGEVYRAVEGLVNLHFALTVFHPVEADHANNLLVKGEAVFNHDLLK